MKELSKVTENSVRKYRTIDGQDCGQLKVGAHEFEVRTGSTVKWFPLAMFVAKLEPWSSKIISWI